MPRSLTAPEREHIGRLNAAKVMLLADACRSPVETAVQLAAIRREIATIEKRAEGK